MSKLDTSRKKRLIAAESSVPRYSVSSVIYHFVLACSDIADHVYKDHSIRFSTSFKRATNRGLTAGLVLAFRQSLHMKSDSSQFSVCNKNAWGLIHHSNKEPKRGDSGRKREKRRKNSADLTTRFPIQPSSVQYYVRFIPADRNFSLPRTLRWSARDKPRLLNINASTEEKRY